MRKTRSGNLAFIIAIVALLAAVLFVAFTMVSSYRAYRYSMKMQMAFFAAKNSGQDIFVKVDDVWYGLDDEAFLMIPQLATTSPTQGFFIRDKRAKQYEFCIGSDAMTVYLDPDDESRAAVYFRCGNSRYMMNIQMRSMQQWFGEMLSDKHLITNKKTDIKNGYYANGEY